MILTISPQGTVRAVYTETIDLDALGQTTIRRASHVEPGPDGWRAEIVGGPTLGSFPKRSEAVLAEVAWIEDNLLYPPPHRGPGNGGPQTRRSDG